MTSRRADDADAAAEAEAVRRGDHRHRAVVDRGERVVAAAGSPAVISARVARELLDVDAGAEAAALGGEQHDAHARRRGRAR